LRIRAGIENIKRRPRRRVVCLSTGVFYDTVALAARVHCVSAGVICGACSGRHVSANGLFFAYEDEVVSADPATIINKRSKRLSRWHEGSAKFRRIPVVCMTDGSTHESVKSAAEAYALPNMTVVNSCRRGAVTAGGLRFRYADTAGPLLDKHKKSPERAKDIRERQANGLRKAHELAQKAVLCVDTGETFSSISAAAEAAHTRVSLVSAAIYRNGRCGGRRYVFAGVPQHGL